ncbi:hypothetical protein M0R45_002257 [Rubus argutus]|uniref:Uncharacterized protein n=1 Tax=Rubus argutus TaxID=59490 RepID=A0AAW1VJW5_RUBAR
MLQAVCERDFAEKRESDGRVQRRRRSFWESRRRRAERKKNRWPVMNDRDWNRGQENWATQRRSRHGQRWGARRQRRSYCKDTAVQRASCNTGSSEKENRPGLDG